MAIFKQALRCLIHGSPITSRHHHRQSNQADQVTRHKLRFVWSTWKGYVDPWQIALDAANTLMDGACGLSDGSVAGDWRLPNMNELKSLVDYMNVGPALTPGHPFVDVNTLYVVGRYYFDPPYISALQQKLA